LQGPITVRRKKKRKGVIKAAAREGRKVLKEKEKK